MPTITSLFREGRLSYSKVREVTRVVDVVDEATAGWVGDDRDRRASWRSMISGFRSPPTACACNQQTRRRVAWREREDGMIDIHARLPNEEAALLISAIDTAKDQFGPPPPKPDPCGDAQQGTTRRGRVWQCGCVVGCGPGVLEHSTAGSLREDRSLVVVHVSAEQPRGRSRGNVQQPAEAVCHIESVGSIETRDRPEAWPATPAARRGGR